MAEAPPTAAEALPARAATPSAPSRPARGAREEAERPPVAAASAGNPDAEELQRLRAENAELQSRFHSGPDPQEWEAWLSASAASATGGRRRFLLLKGRLLQEEWAMRRASHVLGKQQALLSQLHAPAGDGAGARKHWAAVSEALEDAVNVGRAFVDAVPDAYMAEARESLAGKQLHSASGMLLADLSAAYPCFAGRPGGAAQLRSSIVALAGLGIADAGAAASAMELRGLAGHRSRFWSEDLEASWCGIEEQCERRSSRRALRQSVRQMASLASVLALELDLLQVQLDQLKVSTHLRRD